jgi:hypothetical protein
MSILRGIDRVRRFWQKHGRLITGLWGVAALTLFGVWVYSLVTDRSGGWWLLAASTVGIPQVLVRINVPGVRLEAGTLAAPPQKKRRQDASELFRAAIAMQIKYTPQQLQILTDMLLSPTTFRTRVVERITLDRRETRRSVATTYTLANAGYTDALPSELFVPFVVPKKGRLYRDSSVRAGDRVLITLSHKESMELSCALLTMKYREAHHLADNPNYWSETDIERLVCLIDDTVVSPAVQVFGKGFPSLTEHLADYLVNPPSDVGTELIDLAEMLTQRYVVLAVVPSAQRFTVTNEYTLATQDLSANSTPESRLLITEAIRRILRLSTGLVRIPLAHGRKCESYHLELEIPKGSHLGPAAVLHRDSRQVITANDPPATTRTTPYIRRPKQHGTGLQLYGRGLQAVPECDVEVRVYERPVGSELLAATTTTLVALLAIALRAASLDVESHTDIATVLLTLPVALFTVGLIFEPLNNRALNLSLSGIVGAIVSSLFAVLLVLVYVSDVSSREDHLAHWQTFWNLAVVITALCGAISIAVFTIRFTRFISASRRLRPTALQSST